MEEDNKLKMKDDIMFKAFFSRKENHKFLKDFINSILGEEIKIKEVIHDARLEQLAKEEKYGILDLDVELESGEFINIEMQLRNYKNIEKRTTFYAAKKLSEQKGIGINYENLRKVIIITILDYKFTALPEYVTETVRIARGHEDYELNNAVKYYYIELPKFREQNPDMSNRQNQWIAFIDGERGDLLDMAKSQNELVNEADEHYNILTGDEEVKRLAEIRLLSDMEEHSALESARQAGTEIGMEQGLKEGKEQGLKEGKRQGLQEGKEQGLKEGKRQGLQEGKEQGLKEGKRQGLQEGKEQGLKEGKEQGLKEGKEQGLQEGNKEGRIEIAKKLLSKKIDIKEISEITELAIDEIKRLEK